MLEGKKIGPFLIEKELGAGAMGTVYLAQHEKSGVRVAMKIMSPGLGSSEAASARFQREADILKQLKHANIVRMFAHGRFQRMPFYVMEYIEGESLDHVLGRRGRLTWEEVVAIGKQLCAALQHAHEHGIIHRDLKPSNIMILGKGTVKLTDFGIAKDLDVTQLTSANCTVGTAAYMSPEQCRGERNITAKSDLYSLGVMFYELLTGKKPFNADSAMEMFLQHTQGKCERPSRLVLDIPIWLDTLICQLLEKAPAQRPYNANAVAQALERIQEKVEALQSAGVETAKQRRIDRTADQPALDEKDKEAARTLLRKKKKKKTVPFYSQGWFQLASLAGILLGMVWFIWFVFIKPPSAESLLAQANALKGASETKDRQKARQFLQEYLDRYPNHPKFKEVQERVDDLDFKIRQSQMLNRYHITPKDESEIKAHKALDEEKSGNLAKAAEYWQDLIPLTSSNDPDQRGWGFVARNYQEDIKKAREEYKRLKAKVGEEKEAKKGLRGAEPEQLAEGAIRSELQKNTAKAKQQWEDLKKEAEDKVELRPWFLLAAWRMRELEGQGLTPPPPSEEKKKPDP